ncbi:diacylglycerol kinase family protein [Nocardioides zeae]|uniref:Diacylglycerol kinase family protein n=1 Tax=Nocardioides imazamoxiresistens TaxID=3231893 RepID=A0ABU3PX65_9ACTN|nr:diacylglycerol kinase family protein [Nocardioides zeae]MDT9593466.1 diacylglycerol kinase family protein [Nocardioides zeae]
MDPLLVITNAAAGTSDEETLEQALLVLREEASVEVAATSNPGELDGVLHRAGSRTIVVAGGDGSLHAVVNALHRRNELKGRVLGLLPLGTGNDFARGAGIPLEIEDAAKALVDGEVRPVDLLLDELGGVVTNNVHVGAGAQASRRGARWKKRLGKVGVGKVNLGRVGYPIGAALAAVDPPHLRLHVEIDGETVADLDRPVLMVAVGIGSSVGGGAELTPLAEVGDGKADVMVSFATSPMAKLGYVAALTTGRHPEREDVLYRRASNVTVAGEEFWCAADGELSGPERHRSWRVEPAAYTMLLPRG